MALVAMIAVASSFGCELVAGLGDDRHLAVGDASVEDSVAPPPPAPQPPPPPAPPPVDAGDADAPFESGAPPFYVQGNANSSDDAGAASVDYNSPVNAGDMLLVAFDMSPQGATSVLSVTDTQGDTFTKLFTMDGSGLSYWVGACLGAKGGATTVNVQLAAPIEFVELWAHEYANVGSFDMAVGGSGTDMSTDGMKSPPLVTTVPNELIHGWGVTGSADPGTGFQLRSSFHSNVAEDMIAPTPGSYPAIATMSSGSDWSMMALSFKPK
ncbi:MAG TPA: hypothetical protein VIF62_34860 [Labilithrix sp.]